MKKRLLLAIPLLVLSLASCNRDETKNDTPNTEQKEDQPSENQENNQNQGSSDKEDTIDKPSEDPKDEEVTELVTLTTDYVKDGNGGGYMIELDFGRTFAENSSFDCTFNVKNADKTLRITSSREESLTIEQTSLAKNAFTLKTHKPGDSIIKIYDIDGVLVYRNVVKVRKAYDEVGVIEAMYNNDIYEGLKALGNYRLTINSKDSLQGTLRGSDDVESDLQITFSGVYTTYVSEWDMYRYELTTEKQNEESQTRITSLTVSRTGDCINIYYLTGGKEHLLNQFFPLETAEEYNEPYTE